MLLLQFFELCCFLCARRSHSIMVFALRNVANPKRPIVGKLSFIDLAGSERGAGRTRRPNTCVHTVFFVDSKSVHPFVRLII